VTANAPWAARHEHASVIDAAGSIYVLGDLSGSTDNIGYNDVWRSADQGDFRMPRRTQRARAHAPLVNAQRCRARVRACNATHARECVCAHTHARKHTHACVDT
jgi:hypothetical protein